MASPGVSIPDEMIEDVDEIAYERSEPGNSVSRSEIIREAIEEYLERQDRRSGQANDDSVDGAQATN
ncbi:CopG family ribbon-helix-helix protein [Natrinema amylolyticum]|uniref:CopG family ribbon-helix-helix protein n=1 Tax=Natrinema amylolyticum TaxID=2878679 RepID=UPI001CFBC34F|nr:ribbon-helix-helix domain-containing protein [Natrinema amylolyticum]